MMASVSNSIYGLNTFSLMYLLTFKWDEVVQSLRLLNIADSMYLGQATKNTKQVEFMAFIISNMHQVIGCVSTMVRCVSVEKQGYRACIVCHHSGGGCFDTHCWVSSLRRVVNPWLHWNSILLLQGNFPSVEANPLEQQNWRLVWNFIWRFTNIRGSWGTWRNCQLLRLVTRTHSSGHRTPA